MVSLIAGSGLYKLVMRSDETEAEEFQDWVAKVALPTICEDRGAISTVRSMWSPGR